MTEPARADASPPQGLSTRIAWSEPAGCTYPVCDHVEHAKLDWEYTADALPQIVCLLDAAGLIVRGNRSIERWGLGRVAEARGQCLHELMHPGCADPGCYLKRCLDESRERRQAELRCQAMDPVLGRFVDLQLINRPLDPATRDHQRRDHTVAIVADITELKQAEADLQRLARELEQRVEARTLDLTEANDRLQREARVREVAQAALSQSRNEYRRLVETMNEGLAMLNQAGLLTYVNERLADMLGYTVAEMVGRPAVECVDDAYLDFWNDLLAQRRHGGEMTPYELALKGHDGRRVWAKISPSRLVDPDTGETAGSFAVVTDISDRIEAERALRESERELRELSAQVLTAQEKERKRIATELHDGIGQTLSAIKFSVENAIRQLSEQSPGQDPTPLQNIVPKLQRAIEEVRHISMDLRPSILDDLGILATLSWFCREYQADYQATRVELDTDIDECEIPAVLRVVIFRIVQEALNNVAKYARASSVRVRLAHGEDGLELEIRDDGIGFAPARVNLVRGPDSSGMGLLSMRERAEYFGGQFHIDSRTGAGTAIRVHWPASG